MATFPPASTEKPAEFPKFSACPALPVFKEKRTFNISFLVLYCIMALSLLGIAIYAAVLNFNTEGQFRKMTPGWKFFGAFNQELTNGLFNFLLFLATGSIIAAPVYVGARKLLLSEENSAETQALLPQTVLDINSDKAQSMPTRSITQYASDILSSIKKNPTNTALIALSIAASLPFAGFGAYTSIESRTLLLAAQSEQLPQFYREVLTVSLQILQTVGFGFVGFLGAATLSMTLKVVGNTIKNLYEKISGKELSPHVFKTMMTFLKQYENKQDLVLVGLSILSGLAYAAANTYVAIENFEFDKRALIPFLDEWARYPTTLLQEILLVVGPTLIATGVTFGASKLAFFSAPKIVKLSLESFYKITEKIDPESTSSVTASINQ